MPRLKIFMAMRSSPCRGVFIITDARQYWQICCGHIIQEVQLKICRMPTSIVSYIYVGNNDGENLTALKTFSCEEVYEGNVIDDAVSITLVVTAAV
ncbi:hypothetical protein CUMW_219220, partial [Citrus unshiu]